MKTAVYTRVALRSLQAHRDRAKQIRAKIDQYAADPAALANNVIQLTGSWAKRLRVGSFRVLFTETETTITVLDLGPRGEIYEQELNMPVITKTPQGEDIVILSRAEYDALTAGRSGEDRADAAHANEILNEIEKGTETLLTSEQADRLLEAKTPLSFWRRHRGITQEALSKSIGVAQGFISEIENGSKTGDIQTLAAIARVLAISLDDLVIAKPIRRTKRQQAGKRTTTAGRRQTPLRAIKPNSKKSVSTR